MIQGVRRAILSAAHRAGLLAPLRYRLPKRLYRHLALQGDFAVAVEAGISFRLRHYGYSVENDLYWSGWGRGNEPWSERVWLEICRDAEVIIDVGANTGVYALAAKAISPTARVLAVEPVPRIFDKLVENIALNGDMITAVAAAATDHDGSITLYEIGAEHEYSVSADPSMIEGSKPVELPALTLDTIAARHGLGAIDAVKIDVETHEPQVLGGMERSLASEPALLMEVLNPAVGTALIARLAPLGYAAWQIDERRGLAITLEPGLLGHHSWGRNCLFMTETRALTSRDVLRAQPN